jgi:hypothetical protein
MRGKCCGSCIGHYSIPKMKYPFEYLSRCILTGKAAKLCKNYKNSDESIKEVNFIEDGKIANDIREEYYSHNYSILQFIRVIAETKFIDKCKNEEEK